jgi:type I restriction-modification system DNA methylase subunit
VSRRSLARVHAGDDYLHEFIKILEHLKSSKHPYEIFNDWLVMASASLYSWKKDQAVEEEYSRVAKGYTPEELEKHSQLLGLTVKALEDREKDFLGEVFAFAELTNDRTGQFFTPWNVTYMMADMIIGDHIPTDHVCRISDPCCGAGGMLIAGAMVMKQRGISFQHDVLYMGKDVDSRCAQMAFIQLSLLGVPAIIECGDTLRMSCFWKRETIGYHLSGMDFRLYLEKTFETIKKLETPVSADPEKKPESAELPGEINLNTTASRKEYVQGELF